MDEYRRLKLSVDKKLKEQGVARASATDGGASRGTMKTLQRVPDPNHPHGPPGTNTAATPGNANILATGAITEGTTGTPNGTMLPVATAPTTTDVEGHAAAVATSLPSTLPRAPSALSDAQPHPVVLLQPHPPVAAGGPRRASIAIVTPDQQQQQQQHGTAHSTAAGQRSRIKIVDRNEGEGGAGA
ncbi:hypothetical protein BCR44DRAFT_1437327 [Catenaria anguillulae PL171]|uniref:Uncharacterized protein n=1 Tax=Catenaria anguillulae PL171 TaxID=765915 RepID=A0A1Y2HLF8_9FUNG|nr:hypothetical protein BCR44DRAFT_1437327 [Catenaria anguillulae PL171]